MRTEIIDAAKQAGKKISDSMKQVPKFGIILGSGLSNLAKSFGDQELSFSDLPGFPEPGVQGHSGLVVLGDRAVVVAGRFHFYEGHEIDTVCLPVLSLYFAGVKTVVITNAAGGIHDSLTPGDLVLIRDHINMLGANPLRGPNPEGLGPRFSDMSEIYDKNLRVLAKEIDPQVSEGVYVATPGPTYETPAEVRNFRTMGADVVGMSTVPEAIIANWLGMKVIGFSVVTNIAAGLSSDPLDHSEVVETGKKAAKRLEHLLHKLAEKEG
jgi:purine-nucleoside phosphorylase